MAGLRRIKGLTLAAIKRDIQALPIRVAEQVAQDGALEISIMARKAYESGQTAYGTPRPLGVEGRKLSLIGTGDTLSTVLFAYFGTIVRCVLGTPYSRYLIGKYGILPAGKSAMPLAWRQKLDEIAERAIRRSKR